MTTIIYLLLLYGEKIKGINPPLFAVILASPKSAIRSIYFGIPIKSLYKRHHHHQLQNTMQQDPITLFSLCLPFRFEVEALFLWRIMVFMHNSISNIYSLTTNKPIHVEVLHHLHTSRNNVHTTVPPTFCTQEWSQKNPIPIPNSPHGRSSVFSLTPTKKMTRRQPLWFFVSVIVSCEHYGYKKDILHAYVFICSSYFCN